MCGAERGGEGVYGGEAAFSQAFCDAPPVQEFTHEKLMHTITYDKHRKTNSFTLTLSYVCDGAGDLTVTLWRFASLRLAPVSIRMCPLGFPQNTSHVP